MTCDLLVILFLLQAPIIIGKYFSLKKKKLLSEIGPNKVLFCPEIEDIVWNPFLWEREFQFKILCFVDFIVKNL